VPPPMADSVLTKAPRRTSWWYRCKRVPGLQVMIILGVLQYKKWNAWCENPDHQEGGTKVRSKKLPMKVYPLRAISEGKAHTA